MEDARAIIAPLGSDVRAIRNINLEGGRQEAALPQQEAALLPLESNGANGASDVKKRRANGAQAAQGSDNGAGGVEP